MDNLPFLPTYSKTVGMNTFDSIKIVVVDDHQLFIEGVKKVLGDIGDMEYRIVGEANNGKELFRLLRRTEVDLLLLDMNLPDMDGLEILESLKNKSNKPLRIIIITMYDEPKIVKAAFKSGTDGYILKGNGVLELNEAIKEVMLGNTFMGKGVNLTNGIGKRNLGTGSFKSAFQDRFIKKYHLTKRELEVLRLISQAMSNKEIAKELYISDQTVSVHRKNIMRKLGVSNTAGLIKVAYDYSLI